MRFDVITLFPDMITDYCGQSMLQKAQAAGHIEVNAHQLRDYAEGKHRVTDEPPYGGGGGMVLKPGPIFRAVEAVVGEDKEVPVILLTPQGRPFNQQVAAELSQHKRLVMIAGRYEGVDERVRQHLVSDEISIGDYVLTGGELGALVLIDAVSRLIPGVLGDEQGAANDSFASGLLEGPHYTRPRTFRGWDVPSVLLSGNSSEIESWHLRQSILNTWEKYPHLLLDIRTSPSLSKEFHAILTSSIVRLPNSME